MGRRGVANRLPCSAGSTVTTQLCVSYREHHGCLKLNTVKCVGRRCMPWSDWKQTRWSITRPVSSAVSAARH